MGVRLFNLANDPDEQVDISGGNPDVADEMLHILRKRRDHLSLKMSGVLDIKEILCTIGPAELEQAHVKAPSRR